jgi:death-on-curing protein
MAEALPEFLTLEDVLEAHAASLSRWGGQAGIRDLGRCDRPLRSRARRSTATFYNGDPFAMAAAYAFHIAESQAFLDGNKRTGVLAAITFLDMNGFRIPEPEEVLYLAMVEIADRTMTKQQLAGLLRELAGV